MSCQAGSFKKGLGSSTGRYRHYKGHKYEVIGTALHSETEEEFVIYRAEYGERRLWIRPAAMFVETIMVEGRPCSRFQLVTEDPPAPLS